MGAQAFGLSPTTLADFHWVFSRFPEISKVLIYGSRAEGTHKSYSDIDLAVMAPQMTPERFTLLWSEIEDLDLAFKLDVVNFNELENQRLIDSIEATGKEFYPGATLPAYRAVLDAMNFGELRAEIYRRFHDSVDKRFSEYMTHEWSKGDKDRYAAYYTSMYLLADCYESTDEVIHKGLSQNPYLGYLEVWGFLQALFISQDSLDELYRAVCQTPLPKENLTHWKALRNYRNEIARHPANRKGRYRVFFGRHHHDIEGFQYERFDSKTGEIEHPTLNLKAMRHDYFEKDGVQVLRQVIHYIDTHIRQNIGARILPDTPLSSVDGGMGVADDL